MQQVSPPQSQGEDGHHEGQAHHERQQEAVEDLELVVPVRVLGERASGCQQVPWRAHLGVPHSMLGKNKAKLPTPVRSVQVKNTTQASTTPS